MLRLDKVIKPWKESAALNDHINLYGFWNEMAFLTKSGDLGMILSIPGVDYESLDRSEQEYAVKRLEAALKAFGPGFHVYQYLFKSNRPDIPFSTYDDPIVQAAVDQRRKFFEAKRDHLYQVEIFYCILLEGARSKTGVGTALARLLRDPEGAIAELKSQFTNDSMKKLLRTHIERDLQRLNQHVQAFARQLADFMQIEILNRQEQFTFFRRLLNYDDWRVAGRPQSTQFLDYQVVNSDIEAERDHLRVGDHIVRVLTMKEAITETRPLVLDALLKIPANFYVVTEWTPLPADRARKEVNKRRRHFNMSKTGFVSQMGNDTTKTNPRDVLVDESKQADIENLGDCLRVLGDGQSLGDFSLTIVLYGQSRTELDQLVAEFTGVFTNADGNLFAETYNQLNAYFATVPGNYALNLRQLYLLNTNYADLSFLFTILPGEKTNAHLGTEYLAVVETDNSTPYFLNLYTRDVAHTLILGMTGSGKTMKIPFLPVIAVLSLGAWSLAVGLQPLHGSDARTPVLVELFTSEGCSSCPPADRFLQTLDGQPIQGAEIIVLSEHVDYWNHIGWKDPYSASFYSQRQSAYAKRFGLDSVYTPQIVVDGTSEFVGSNSGLTDKAFRKALGVPKLPVHLSSISADTSNTLHAHLETGALDLAFGSQEADVYVVVALNRAESQVSAGENSGHRLSHVAVVKSLTKIGALKQGQVLTQDVQLKLELGSDPRSLRLIAFVQEPRQGRVLGAAVMPVTAQ